MAMRFMGGSIGHFIHYATDTSICWPDDPAEDVNQDLEDSDAPQPDDGLSKDHVDPSDQDAESEAEDEDEDREDAVDGSSSSESEGSSDKPGEEDLEYDNGYDSPWLHILA